MEKLISYYRNPTQGEIGFGYGCLHYIDLPVAKLDSLLPSEKDKT